MSPSGRKTALFLSIIALGVSALSVLYSLNTNSVPVEKTTESALYSSPLLSALEGGELVVGYGGYPPYTTEDPNTGEVSGFSVDLLNEVASQLNIELTWKKFNWSTMSADLKRGDIDIIAEPIFQTIPRAREFTFTDPYMFVPSGVGIIRTGSISAPSFSHLNSSSLKVAVGQGHAEETLVRARLPKADILAVSADADTAASANLVLSGRADVAIVTLSDAKRFLGAHPGKLQGLWMSNPPAYMPAGFALRLGDQLGAGFLNAVIVNLRYNGILEDLASKYHIEQDFQGWRSESL